MVRRLQRVALRASGVAVALAVVAACGSDDGPRALPVQGLQSGATSESAAGAATMDMRIGGVRYEVTGELAELAGEARAWVTTKGDPAGRLGPLLDALGVDGTVQRTESGWRVVDGDDRVEVTDVPGLPWSFWHELAEPEGAASSGSAGSVESTVVDPDGSVSSPPDEPVTDEPGDVRPAPEPAPEPERPADLPSAAEARDLALAVIRAAGVDVEGAAVRVDDGFTVWMVTADPVLGGLPTLGYGTTVSVGSQGRIEWANGWLADADGGDEYPLIGTDAALDRLQEQAGPQIMLDDATGAEPAVDAGGSETMIAPADCPPDADCPAPEPVVVQVTGVRLGLLFMPFYEGDEAWLVPAYLFELDGGDGGELPIVGVADEFVVPPPTVETLPAEDVPAEDVPGRSEPGYPGPDGATIDAEPVEE